jgi:type II secretory pathway component GspD/PulD (secretin)
MMAMNRARRTAGVFVLIVCVGHWSLALAQPPSPASPGELATARTISLDLKGVDVLDVLKLLSQKSGLNFVAGRNVTGRVTIFAKDVDIWEAFERIVDANDLAYERHGELVTVMMARDYELLYGEKFQERKRSAVIALQFAKAAQVATVLNQLKSNVGRVVVDEATNTVILDDAPSRLEDMRGLVEQLDRPVETRIYTLNYAEAEKLKEKVQEFLTPGVGTFSVDARTNKVVITDLQDAMEKVDRVIRAFDAQEGEVLIEARIVKVELTDEQSLGVDWQQVFGGVDTKARGNFRLLSDIVEGTATGAAVKFLSAPTGKTQVILEALKKFGKVETVSNPRIAVSNNQEAKILVGTKEAFVTVTTTVPATGATVSSPQIQFVDVGTKLFVTPRIKPDGHVQLKIRPEVSTAKVETFQSNRIPIVSTTEAETNVLVKSGATLIIGGLIDSKTERTQSQLPLLGDIPGLGAAFRSRVDTHRKTELVVFLTPQIISTSGESLTRFPSAQAVEQVAATKEQEADVVPASYRAVVRGLLQGALTRQLHGLSAGQGSLMVSFTLARDGRLLGDPEIASEQGEAFVQAATAALESLEPFPQFPDEVRARAIRFRLAVDYRPTD